MNNDTGGSLTIHRAKDGTAISATLEIPCIHCGKMVRYTIEKSVIKEIRTNGKEAPAK